MRTWAQAFLLVAFLLGLYLVAGHVPNHASWAIHFFFALTLTILVHRHLLKGGHTKLYLAGLIVAMAAWETREWFLGVHLEASTRIIVVDTFFDTVSGLLGALIAIKWGGRWPTTGSPG